MDVKIYTDGAARGNPDGPGGYGTVIQFIDGKGTLHERELTTDKVKVQPITIIRLQITAWSLWQLLLV